MKYLFLFSYFSIYCMCQPKRLRANGRLLSQMHSPRHPCGTPIPPTNFALENHKKIQGNTIAVYLWKTTCIIGRNGIQLAIWNLLRWICHFFLSHFFLFRLSKCQMHQNNFKIYEIEFLLENVYFFFICFCGNRRFQGYQVFLWHIIADLQSKLFQKCHIVKYGNHPFGDKF